MLDEESRQITTFVTHLGLFRFKRFMFGVNSAPEMYQHLMSQIIADINGVVNFIDDIIVYAESEKEHDIILNTLLKRLEDKHLTLNKEV